MYFKDFTTRCWVLFNAVVFIFVINVQTQETSVDTLKLVQVIFRHGERVPEYPYPTDPYNNETFWKEGWGQLTEVGKGQEYALGQYLRARYQNYLSDNYVANEIHAVTSDADRTIMSAELCLAGLYPTVNGTSWNPDLNWQPVPIHTIAKEYDNLIWLKKPCPRFQTELDDYLYNSPEMMKINKDNKEIFEVLSKGSGVNITNIDLLDKFYATIMVEEMLGLPLPEWGVPILNTPNFQYLYNISYPARTGTPELKRLRAGPLTKYLVDNINTKVSNSSMKTKFFMLSAHDITLVAILDTLGVFDLQRPYYSSVFMLELHQNPDTHDYFVQMFLRNETDKEPYKLRLPGCDFNCPLQTLLNYTKPIIPEDWDMECQLAVIPVTTSHSVIYFIVVVLIGVVVAGIAVYLVYILMKKRGRSGEPRTNYQQF